jgi:putative ABC transport system permease protein
MTEAVWQDLKYSGRTFRRAPGFALLAIFTVAIGIGATSAIFSIVNAVLLRPLPFPRADDLVLVSQINLRTRQSQHAAAPANFLDWRERSHSFGGLAAVQSASVAIADADHAERINGAMVNANFFDVLGVKPALGRAFTPADEQPGAQRVVVLSHSEWLQRFGGQVGVLGQSARVDEVPHTIVGVMPPGVDYPDKAAVWVPPHFRVPDDPQLGPTQDPSAERGHTYFEVLARLKPGTSLGRAGADMEAVAATLERDYPDDDQGIGAGLTRLRDDLVGDVRPTVRLLFAAVALLLLIATANVSGLLIARATGRHQEIAVRVALGATRRRILTQLLTESVLLAIVGGACGVLVAMWLIGPLVALSPDSLEVAGSVRIDGTVLLFALLTSTSAGLLFGLAPARQLSRLNVHDDLKQSSRGTTSARQRRVRAGLVAAEIALSLVLLVAAGLTIKSFIRLQQVSSGFAVDNVLTVRVSPPSARYSTPALRADFYQRIIEALRQVPGVLGAGATSRLPLLPGNSGRGLTIPGLSPEQNANASANYRTATPDYFRVMGIPLLRGRAFDENDREDRPPVAVISAALAQQYWPNQDPIGRQFSINAPLITIVGVVGDVHAAALDRPPQPTVYVPYRQDAFPYMTFVVKTAAPPAAVAAAMRAALQRLDTQQPFGDVVTMDAQLEHSLARRRFSVTLLTAFGAVAVTLAVIGLYGVLAFIVAQRKREIGVRIALGASAFDIVSDVAGHGLRLALLGVAIGLGLSLAATRLLSALLYGTSATDAATFASVAAMLAIIATAASLVPAFRASRVDPLAALRDD